jgi:hypothetical protein
LLRVSFDFHPLGCIKVHAAHKSPLLSPLY